MTDVLREFLEPVARAICERHEATPFDMLPKNKTEWTKQRGEFGGRYRDVNEPMQCDYLDMADAALNAPALRALLDEVEGLRERYDELIYAVATVTPGETRHHTALRYITERENRPAQGPAQAA